MCIQYCHRFIENLYLMWEKQVCNFVIFCKFFACARSFLKKFRLETEHLFYMALVGYSEMWGVKIHCSCIGGGITTSKTVIRGSHFFLTLFSHDRLAHL